MLGRYSVIWCQRVLMFLFLQEIKLVRLRLQTVTPLKSSSSALSSFLYASAANCFQFAHTSLVLGRARDGLSLNTELQVYFLWLSPLWGSFLLWWLWLFWAHFPFWFFQPEWWWAFNWNFSHWDVATLRTKPQKTGNFTLVTVFHTSEQLLLLDTFLATSIIFRFAF